MDFPSVISQVTVQGGFPVGRAVGSPLGGMGRYPVIPVVLHLNVDRFRQAGVATHSACMQRKTSENHFPALFILVAGRLIF